MQHLMKIDAVFSINGRDLMAVGETDRHATYKVGDKVMLVKSSGITQYATRITGVERYSSPPCCPGQNRTASIYLADLTKNDVAAQDDLYLVEEKPKRIAGTKTESDAHSEA